MKKQIYEIIEELRNTKHLRQALIQNDCTILREVLIGAYNPNIKFIVETWPSMYKDPLSPPEMGYATLEAEMRKMYLFIEGHPKANGLSRERRLQLLLQFLEGLERKEAEIIIDMFNKDLKIPGLTREFLKSVFLDLNV